MTLLEIYPPSCLLVVGPQVAIATENTTGSSSNSNGFPYSYRATVEAGMRAAVEALPPDASEEEKKGQQRLLRDAYNLDPTLAAHKMTEILKERGCYADWMKKTFAEHVTTESQPNTTLQHLLNLQGNGALLACTQYDTCLDSAAGTNPVLMGEKEMFQKWADGEVPGFLHLHGVFSKPSSVQLDGVNYVNYLSESNPTGYNTLREIFRKRTVIFVGYDSNYFDPLILTFLKVVCSDDSVLRNPPILLACDVPCPLEAMSSFLLFKVSKEELLRLEDTLSPGSEKNFAIGEGVGSRKKGREGRVIHSACFQGGVGPIGCSCMHVEGCSLFSRHPLLLILHYLALSTILLDTLLVEQLSWTLDRTVLYVSQLGDCIDQLRCDHLSHEYYYLPFWWAKLRVIKCKTVCTTHIAEQDEFSMCFDIDSFVIKYATHYDYRQF